MDTSQIKAAPISNSPASPMPEISEIQSARQSISTQVLPRTFVMLDTEVREGFLSDDLETICDAATKSGATILIATAGKPLEDRKTSFKLWRKNRLETLYCEGLPEFLSNNTDPELCASFRDATVDLLALDAAIQNETETKIRKASELRKAQKEKLKAALNSHCEGCSHPHLPQHLVVRGDGELRLVKNFNKVKEWGSIGNHGYYTVPLQIENVRLRFPEPE
jgi:hypothetical protein